MIGTIANAALWLAGLSSLGAAMACVRRSALEGLEWPRRLLTVAAMSLLATCALLAWSLLRDDFRLEYVASHSSRAMSGWFKLAAVWSGQEGSLLLWATLVALLGALSARGTPQSGAGPRMTLGTLGAVVAFFAFVLLGAANPFAACSDPTLPDGQGLSPLLRNWAMVAHPPALFTGYAAATIPFVLAMGALVGRGFSDDRLAAMRRWTLVAWLFLTLGIGLGAWWAYNELGWGGYWAWDPVENASLLPWLTATGLMHTLSVQRRTRRLGGWTVALSLATFLLCIAGACITRGGLIESVHAFATSSIGAYFLCLLVAALTLGVILAIRGRAMFAGDLRPALVSRESAVVLANAMLCLMACATLVGSVLPLISRIWSTASLSVGAAYYNRTVIPLALLVGTLMTIGPMLPVSGAGVRVTPRRLVSALLVALTGCVIAAFRGLVHPAGLVCVGLGGIMLAFLVLDLANRLGAAARNDARTPWRSGWLAVWSGRGRLAMMLGHAGFMLVMLGVAGSSILGTVENASLRPGESVQVGGTRVRFDGLRQRTTEEYLAAEATLVVSDSRGEHVLHPQQRYYSFADEPTGEVSIRSSWRSDLYIALVGWEERGVRAAFQIRVNPLVAWIWCGVAVMSFGAGLSLVARTRLGVRSIRLADTVREPPASPALSGWLKNEEAGHATM